MTISRTNEDSNEGGLASLFNNVTGAHSFINSPSNNINKIIDIGGAFGTNESVALTNNLNPAGNQVGSFENPSNFGFNYGEWTLIPNRTFSATVRLWGAGGGSHSYASTAYGGGGGHARASVVFLDSIPYTFWVGQGGTYAQHRGNSHWQRHTYRLGSTFGNGGGGTNNSGSGGGLSGLFFNTLGHESAGAGVGPNTHSNGAYSGVQTWFRTPSPQNALLIAGGGGGAGHNNQASHGQAGGGGGTSGNPGHNNTGGSQTAGGNAGYSDASAGSHFQGGHAAQGSVSGGGGGGWYGGGGGGHSGSHYNGGAGGSGHSLESASAGFRNFWIKSSYGELVTNSYLETSPSSHSNPVNMAAASTDPDWQYAGIGAGTAQVAGNSSSLKYLGQNTGWYSGTNGRITIRIDE